MTLSNLIKATSLIKVCKIFVYISVLKAKSRPQFFLRKLYHFIYLKQKLIYLPG